MLSCCSCLELKPRDDFYKRPDRVRGYQSSCKECQHKTRKKNKDKRYKYYKKYYRDWSRKTRRDYLEQIGGNNVKNCLICKKEFENGKEKHVDHCHISGAIRGILCRSCNCGLGNFKDSVDILKNAIKYLKEAKKTGTD